MSNTEKEYRKDLIRNYKREYTKQDEEDWNEKVIDRNEYYDLPDPDEYSYDDFKLNKD
jgi:hypothetical protein